MNEFDAAKLYTPREVGDIFKVSAYTIREWIKAGKLRAVKTPGGRIRIPGNVIQELAEKEYGNADQ